MGLNQLHKSQLLPHRFSFQINFFGLLVSIHIYFVATFMVRNKAIGINVVDIYYRKGVNKADTLPFTLADCLQWER
ncbi:hypothetical protein Hdeb2414_s0044g00742671 [Helianthus debilis subsp. tardiflorus]